MDSEHKPYPRREDAREDIGENPARFIVASNQQTRQALIRGMTSLRRLAWWERVIDEEDLDAGRVERLLEQKREDLVGETDDEPTAEEVDAKEARIADVEAAATVDAVEAIQQDEVSRDEPRREVIAAVNQRLDELRADEDDEEAAGESEADTSDNAVECPFCGNEDTVNAFLFDDQCPECEAALTEICDAGSIDDDADSQEVTA